MTCVGETQKIDTYTCRSIVCLDTPVGHGCLCCLKWKSGKSHCKLTRAPTQVGGMRTRHTPMFLLLIRNSTLRYECDETFSDECELAARAEGEWYNHTCQENVFRTSIVRNFISRGVKMRISAREACVKPHLCTRSDIKYIFKKSNKNWCYSRHPKSAFE